MTDTPTPEARDAARILLLGLLETPDAYKPAVIGKALDRFRAQPRTDTQADLTERVPALEHFRIAREIVNDIVERCFAPIDEELQAALVGDIAAALQSERESAAAQERERWDHPETGLKWETFKSGMRFEKAASDTAAGGAVAASPATAIEAVDPKEKRRPSERRSLADPKNGPHPTGVSCQTVASEGDDWSIQKPEAECKEQEIARLRRVLDIHAQMMHPWYGSCDSLAPDGQCAECLKTLGRSSSAAVLQSERESAAAEARRAALEALVDQSGFAEIKMHEFEHRWPGHPRCDAMRHALVEVAKKLDAGPLLASPPAAR